MIASLLPEHGPDPGRPDRAAGAWRHPLPKRARAAGRPCWAALLVSALGRPPPSPMPWRPGSPPWHLPPAAGGKVSRYSPGRPMAGAGYPV